MRKVAVRRASPSICDHEVLKLTVMAAANDVYLDLFDKTGAWAEEHADGGPGAIVCAIGAARTMYRLHNSVLQRAIGSARVRCNSCGTILVDGGKYV